MLIYSVLTLKIVAQTSMDSTFIAVRALVTTNGIKLRWSASNYELWDRTNHTGFTVERYTLKQNGKVLEKPIKNILNTSPFKAHPENEWDQLSETNFQAAMIWQALYGEKIELTAGSNNPMQIINTSRTQDQRFLLSMYAADLSYEAAEYGAWAYTDTTAQKGCNYLYRIVPADTCLLKKIDLRGIYVSSDIISELPKPMQINAKWGDKSVTLNWDYDLLAQTYIAYYVEKSDDGKTYKRISNVPSINVDDSPTMTFVDSLSQNNRTYYYRINGVSSFGETGPYSDVLSGKGRAELTAAPVITSYLQNTKGQIEIEWQFDPESNSLLHSFELLRSDTYQGNYNAVVQKIDPAKRKITFPCTEPSNYFAIAAMPFYGKSKQSLSVLVQPADSIAPLSPKNLNYVIDSTGVVLLKWDANTEKDLQGYRVYRSMTKNGEFIMLNDIAFLQCQFTDKIELNNLDKYLYYRVGSVDKRYNQSPLSEILEVRRPDRIPPTSPLITDFKSNQHGITINWVNPNVEDLDKILIYRSDTADSMHMVSNIINLQTMTYTDTDIAYGTIYKYSLRAVDDSGLQSDFSPTVSIKSSYSPVVAVTKFTADYTSGGNGVQLKWTTSNSNLVGKIQVYRKVGNQAICFWKNVTTQQLSLTDNEIIIGNDYEYLLKITPKQGNVIYSKTVKINF